MTRDYAEAVSSKKLTESEVMEQHRNLVMWVYNRMRHRLSDAAEPDDYLQEGYVGLLLAWRKWNPDRGEFSTYAVSIIRRAMLLTDRRVRRQLGYHVSWEQGIGSDAEVTIGDTVADEHSAVGRVEHGRLECCRSAYFDACAVSSLACVLNADG